MSETDYPRLILSDQFSERDAFEIRLKGWFYASIELEDGSHHTLNFYDPVRLKQEFDDDVKNGRGCFAEPNLIIVAEVTIEAVQAATRFLWETGYFKRIKSE